MSARTEVVVLGASGGVGRLLVAPALNRGHEVHALVRDPARYDPTGELAAREVQVHRVDVHDRGSVAAAIGPTSVVVSGLGVRGKGDVGVLTAGAEAVVAAAPRRIVWLGAVGTGPSDRAVGRLVHRLLRAGFGADYADKVAADTAVLAAGGTVLHSGPLGARSAARYAAVPMDRAGRQWFPASVPRAAVAQVMLDLAEVAELPGGVVLPRRVRG